MKEVEILTKEQVNKNSEKVNKSIKTKEKKVNPFAKAEAIIINSLPSTDELRDMIKQNKVHVDMNELTAGEKSSKGRINMMAEEVIVTNKDGKTITINNKQELRALSDAAKQKTASPVMDMSAKLNATMEFDDDDD